MRWSAVSPLVFLAVLMAAVTGCGSGDSDDAASTTTLPTKEAVALPAGQDLYSPPEELRPGPPGSLVWYDEGRSIGEARAWRTLSRSTGFDGRPTWVTGTLYRPIGPAPEGGFPVVVWVHGTAGSADECAPSRAQVTVPAIGDLLSAGFVVAAPDGTGLGPPGPAHYLVGVSEGRAALDAARAAQEVPGADAGDEVALWGNSSGGHAVLFAAQEAEEYAPDLTLLGTAAAAPVSDVARFAGRSAAFPLTFGYAFLTFGAWSQVYDVDASTIFAPGVVDDLPLLDEECSTTIAPRFALTPIEELRSADPLTTRPWRGLLADNEAGREPTSGPVLLVQGEADPIIAPDSTEALAAGLCDLGVTVQLRLLPGESHDVVLISASSTAAWFAERSAGVPARDTCAP